MSSMSSASLDSPAEDAHASRVPSPLPPAATIAILQAGSHSLLSGKPVDSDLPWRSYYATLSAARALSVESTAARGV